MRATLRSILRDENSDGHARRVVLAETVVEHPDEFETSTDRLEVMGERHIETLL
jgi:hypothetical protein